MDGNSGLVIALFILFIRDGLSQRHGSFGHQPASSGFNSYNSQGLASSYGESQYNSQFGSLGTSLEGGSRRVGDTSSWNSGSSFGSSRVEDNGWKFSSSGNNNNKNNNNQLNSGSAWNSGAPTGGYGINVPSSNAGYHTGSSGFSNGQNGNPDWKNNRGTGGGSSGWNFGNEKEEQKPSGQSGKRQSSSNKEDNQRKTNAGSGSKRPTDSSGGSGFGLSFGFPNENSKKAAGSDYGGSSDSSFGLDLKRPQGSSGGGGGGGNSNWGTTTSNFTSKRPQGSSSSSSSTSSWSSGNQNGDRKPSDLGGIGFSSSKDEKNQERPNQNGWNSGSGDPTRKSEISSGSSGSSSGGYGTHSSSNKPQGNSGSGTGSSNWGSSSNSDSKNPQGASNSGYSNQGFGSSYDSKRPQGGSNSGSNPDSNFNPDFDSKRPQGSSSSSSNSGSGYFSSKKPDDNQGRPDFNSERRPSSNPREPQKKQPENANTQPNKTGGNENANEKKTEQVDWGNLEMENQQGSITFDFSELWHSNDRKDPAWRSIWTRNRFRRENDASDKVRKFSPVCQCVNYPVCPPENRVGVTKFLQHYHRDLRVRMMECASMKKICCVTSRSEENDRKPACGRRVSKLAEHDISNDGSPNHGDYPWILRLVTRGETGEETLCSASLIHNSMALTTASCALLLAGKDVRVRSGEWNVVGGHDKNKMEETTLGKVYLHPDFDVVSYTKDLALLFFDRPFHLDRGANTVCLPTHQDSWDASKCVVVGWTRKNGSGLKSVALKQVDLQIVAQGKCHRQEESRNVLSDFEDPGFFCSHSRKDDPNLGDVGASLLCPLYNSEAFIQVGFVSNPVPEKRNRKMTTFTDILDSLDWVYRMERIYTFVAGEDANE